MQTPKRIFDLLAHQQLNYSTLPMFSFKKDEQWEGITAVDLQKEIDKVSLALLELGVQKGEKVGIVSENRIEWNIFDFAIQQIGAVVVAVYPNISENDYTYIFNHAEIRFCFVSTDLLYHKVASIVENVPSLKKLYTFNSYDFIPHYKEILPIVSQIDIDKLQSLKESITANDIATLIYTSGTTGNPKGVMLTHKNLLADMYSSEYSFPVKAYQRALTFLPVCHAYERLFHYVYFYKGVTVYFATSIETIGEDMKTVKPHIFSAVPRVLEKVYDKIMATGNQLTGVKKQLFFWAIRIGEQFEFDNKNIFYKLQLALARKLIFSKWREALGGEVGAIASGSATLQKKLIKVYWAAGIPIYEGYGLTEAGPCLSVNCYKRGLKMGTVGLPLINIDIKLADDGEILAKGDNIMLGYYKDEKATSEVIKDGWLHTGDIGEWVGGKFLKIIDRKKEMFKTSGGKYIVPQQIEKILVEHPFIEQAMVIGENQKFPAAFIVPNYSNILEWTKQNLPKSINLTKEKLFEQIEIVQLFNQIVKDINQQFGNFEQIKKISLLSNEFTVETGELTPTLKMKRKFILQKFSKQYDEIFGL